MTNAKTQGYAGQRNDRDLVVCYSDAGDGGWSLHAPGSTDDEIAEGTARVLVSGTGPITADDYAAARRMLYGRAGEAATRWIDQGIDASTALMWENID